MSGSDKVVLSNYQVVNKGKSNVVRLLSLSEKNEQVALHWDKKQPKSIYYYEDGKKVKLTNKENQVTVLAKGVMTVQIEW